MANGHLIAAISQHTDTVYCLQFSRDGAVLASGGFSRLWRLRYRLLSAVQPGRRRAGLRWVLSPVETQIPSTVCSSAGTAPCWPQVGSVACGDTDTVYCLQFSRDGAVLASGGFCRLWRLRYRLLSAVQPRRRRAGLRWVLSPVETQIPSTVCSSAETAPCWPQVGSVACGDTDTVYCLQFSRDGAVLASGGFCRLWRLRYRLLSAVQPRRRRAGLRWVLSPVETQIPSTVCSSAETAPCWPQVGSVACGDSDTVYCLQFSRDGAVLASGGFCRLWRHRYRLLSAVQPGRRRAGLRWVLSPVETQIPSTVCSSAETAPCWPQVGSVACGDTDTVYCLQFSRDGAVLASGGFCRLWRLRYRLLSAVQPRRCRAGLRWVLSPVETQIQSTVCSSAETAPCWPQVGSVACGDFSDDKMPTIDGFCNLMLA